jgi:hypothetical protein
MANGPYTGPLTMVKVQKYTHSEPRFRALLTEDGAERLEVARPYKV